MKFKVFLGILISALFIYFSFWSPDFGRIFSGEIIQGIFGNPRIDIGEMLKALSKANFLIPIIIMFLVYLGWWIRAWRWQILVSPLAKVSASVSFSALMIGYLGNSILPLRAGEFMRSYVAGKRGGIPMSAALAVVVVERVLDMLMLLFCLSMSLVIFPLPVLFREAGILMIIGTFVLIGFLLLLLLKKEEALKIAQWFLKAVPSKFRPKLLKIISDFSDGLQIFKRSERYFMVILWTFIMWGTYLLVIYVSLMIFDFIDPTYPLIYNAPLVAAIVILTMTTAGISIPSAPGAVGTYHGMCLFGMQMFNVPSELGMSYAILMHLTNFFPMTVIGVYCLFKEGFKLAELSGAVKKEH
jgi:glycosyltransferase 2 family protein